MRKILYRRFIYVFQIVDVIRTCLEINFEGEAHPHIKAFSIKADNLGKTHIDIVGADYGLSCEGEGRPDSNFILKKNDLMIEAGPL